MKKTAPHLVAKQGPVLWFTDLDGTLWKLDTSKVHVLLDDFTIIPLRRKRTAKIDTLELQWSFHFTVSE